VKNRKFTLGFAGKKRIRRSCLTPEGKRLITGGVIFSLCTSALAVVANKKKKKAAAKKHTEGDFLNLNKHISIINDKVKSKTAKTEVDRDKPIKKKITKAKANKLKANKVKAIKGSEKKSGFLIAIANKVKEKKEDVAKVINIKADRIKTDRIKTKIENTKKSKIVKTDKAIADKFKKDLVRTDNILFDNEVVSNTESNINETAVPTSLEEVIAEVFDVDEKINISETNAVKEIMTQKETKPETTDYEKTNKVEANKEETNREDGPENPIAKDSIAREDILNEGVANVVYKAEETTTNGVGRLASGAAYIKNGITEFFGRNGSNGKNGHNGTNGHNGNGTKNGHTAETALNGKNGHNGNGTKNRLASKKRAKVELPEEFPQNVLQQAERNAKPVSEADMLGRKDLRRLCLVTIDGADARDLDDAVSIEKSGDNYILGVHIADVANYVQAGSAVDKEAYKRGTSVYFPDRVIPMLPPVLSNGICSLNAGEDRLSLSCIMTINPEGEITSHRIFESVVNVTKRLNYDEVQTAITDGNSREAYELKPFMKMLTMLKELSQILSSKRESRGAINFNFPEIEVVLNRHAEPTGLRRREGNIATQIIEECMIAANETVATEYYERHIPFLYRAHLSPDPDRVAVFSAFIEKFGYSILVKNGKMRPKAMQRFIASLSGTREENLLSRLALRTMQHAYYTAENKGHFGLASPCYTHFTSPIRRYPDLQIHRIIKDDYRRRLNDDKIKRYQKLLPQVAMQSSETERRGEEAERDSIKKQISVYMKTFVGNEYEGIISGVADWGFYVEIENGAEGLVHMRTLTDDYYSCFPLQYRLIGKHKGRVFELGQKVQVILTSADTETGNLDFVLA
jgi:ribonuclease R